MLTVAIIGSGPTGIYTAHTLLASKRPLKIVMFESQAQAGKGTPYHPKWNDPAMLAHIASIEIPPLPQTLVGWLESQSDDRLARMGIDRSEIDERAFFPRVTLGEYFREQLHVLVSQANYRGHSLDIRTLHNVEDMKMLSGGIELSIRHNEKHIKQVFSHVIVASGYRIPLHPEVRPGYFVSPWPANALRTIGNGRVGVRGTSLTAIDAVVALAQARGTFLRNEKGTLQYLPEAETENFSIVMMSRKGLLPEADFYHPIPYEPLRFCTNEAVDRLHENGSGENLLENVFALFATELVSADPDYAKKLGFPNLSLEAFSQAYFRERQQHEPFVWAARNLAEAKSDEAAQRTVAWRYAILRMHEVIGRMVRFLPSKDLVRFHRYFKPVFVDDYATVPHLSIERLLALHHAGKLSVCRLGKKHAIDTQPAEGGAVLHLDGQTMHFQAFIEATGQHCLPAQDFPFSTLLRQGIIRAATAPDDESDQDIGGIALNEYYQPDEARAANLYCLAIPFMLAQFPFSQGITSSYAMGKTVANTIIEKLEEDATVKPHTQSRVTS